VLAMNKNRIDSLQKSCAMVIIIPKAGSDHVTHVCLIQWPTETFDIRSNGDHAVRPNDTWRYNIHANLCFLFGRMLRPALDGSILAWSLGPVK